MAAHDLAAAPVLSTPDTHIFDEPTPPPHPGRAARLTEEQLALTYEIARTVEEIRTARWKRIALQFPDGMLADAPRVFEALGRRLARARLKSREARKAGRFDTENNGVGVLAQKMPERDIGAAEASGKGNGRDLADANTERDGEEELFILGDTSYGACCVDEVAALHVDADAVVHYGRACLSPTARLPVLHIFTRPPLDASAVADAFRRALPDRAAKVVLAADAPYAHHVPIIYAKLTGKEGYDNVFATEVVHEPSSQIPNRTVPEEVRGRSGALREYALFHVAQPPDALLLTLASRVAAVHIYPVEGEEAGARREALRTSTAAALRRRYALLTAVSTAPILGILVNTLSVKNYLHVVERVRARIAAAGKKSYTFVVGKVNAAKVANFSEVAGWVVIGCWESSLIENREFWRPMVTPFELELALQGDAERVWTGEWTSDFQAVLETAEKERGQRHDGNAASGDAPPGDADQLDGDFDSEESAPPEYDLRTGQYVSRTRPMQQAATAGSTSQVSAQARSSDSSRALTRRANGDVAQVGGVVSPGAEYLRSNRTWRGLGSDFEIAYEEDGSLQGASMEEGRRGLARGYAVGDDKEQAR